MEIQTRTPKPIAGSLSLVRLQFHPQAGVAVDSEVATVMRCWRGWKNIVTPNHIPVTLATPINQI